MSMINRSPGRVSYYPNYRSAGAVAGMAYLTRKALPYAGPAMRYASKIMSNYHPTANGKKMVDYQKPVQQVTIVPKRKLKKPRTPTTLKSKVASLQKQMKAYTSKCTVRYNDVFRLLSLQNQTATFSHQQNDIAAIESAITNLRFFDPTNPGVLIQGNGATGTYKRTFQISSSYVYNFRNNYKVPLEMKIYKYKVKSDTTITPLIAFTNGLADIGNPASTSTVVYPSDSDQLKELWSSQGVISVLLKPGQSKKVMVNSPQFDYDPSLTDSHGQSFQKAFHAQAIFIRILGVPAHDKTIGTQLGIIQVGIDYSEKATFIIKYNSGGPDLDYLVVNDQVDAMTSGPVISQVVVGNQEYSPI